MGFLPEAVPSERRHRALDEGGLGAEPGAQHARPWQARPALPGRMQSFRWNPAGM